MKRLPILVGLFLSLVLGMRYFSGVPEAIHYGTQWTGANFLYVDSLAPELYLCQGTRAQYPDTGGAPGTSVAHKKPLTRPIVNEDGKDNQFP